MEMMMIYDSVNDSLDTLNFAIVIFSFFLHLLQEFDLSSGVLLAICGT